MNVDISARSCSEIFAVEIVAQERAVEVKEIGEVVDLGRPGDGLVVEINCCETEFCCLYQ